ncbi:fumarylacetoacetate hydrolase family protein [Chitinimonas sp.]|uniref:fumarylacetoacetate hydrolase family protein n=1 Tax=Chitinimonas sp. TaxID=1934313 RepID=UPI002F931D5A
MQADQIHAAAHILATRRLKGEQGPVLPESCRPHDLDTALAIQGAVAAQMGQAIGGWKCALPSEGKLVVAPIYAPTIHTLSPCTVWARSGKTRIEPEIAFLLGKDLPARDQPYTPAEVDTAIAASHLALELIDSRYAPEAGNLFPDNLADGLVNQGLYIGPELDANIAAQLNEFELTLEVVGETQQRPARHPDGLPRRPLYWLAEWLRSRDQGLKAGQWVITGSYAGAVVVPVGVRLRVKFGGVGVLSVCFEEK